MKTESPSARRPARNPDGTDLSDKSDCKDNDNKENNP